MHFFRSELRLLSPSGGDPLTSTFGDDPLTSAFGGDPLASAFGGDPLASASGGDPLASASGGDPLASAFMSLAARSSSSSGVCILLHVLSRQILFLFWCMYPLFYSPSLSRSISSTVILTTIRRGSNHPTFPISSIGSALSSIALSPLHRLSPPSAIKLALPLKAFALAKYQGVKLLLWPPPPNFTVHMTCLSSVSDTPPSEKFPNDFLILGFGQSTMLLGFSLGKGPLSNTFVHVNTISSGLYCLEPSSVPKQRLISSLWERLFLPSSSLGERISPPIPSL